MSKVVKDEILQRTLGDVLCDVTRLGKVQTWVTLQPNSDYNPYKTCSSNRQLNVSQTWIPSKSIYKTTTKLVSQIGQTFTSEHVKQETLICRVPYLNMYRTVNKIGKFLQVFVAVSKYMNFQTKFYKPDILLKIKAHYSSKYPLNSEIKCLYLFYLTSF